jgi:hypothetical protein
VAVQERQLRRAMRRVVGDIEVNVDRAGPSRQELLMAIN